MSALRAWLASVLEWGIAAGVMLLLLSLGALVHRELRAANRPQAIGGPGDPMSSPHIPARAIAVPMLLLPDGNEVRTGHTMAQVATMLGRGAETGQQYLDRVPSGERITRFYDHAGTRFILVFQAKKSGDPPRVAGIYVQ